MQGVVGLHCVCCRVSVADCMLHRSGGVECIFGKVWIGVVMVVADMCSSDGVL